ncbi:DNA primase [Rhodococcus phage Weasels2]|uniref:DNA primase n=1 Tax=Rhodococcus phage Weasels2 TaxID=1897437 RepID=A0A1I9SA82_9CAUD|nr:DNA primase [Rhodococcus phage Weasels2]AOZ63688.1 DNA primase [Rhodococcus phage Weasels2]
MRKNSLFGWKDYSDQISVEDLYTILEEIGIETASETDTHILVYCPFHNNRHSPAATVSKQNGFVYCWGAGCNTRMNLQEIVQEIKEWDRGRAMRFIEKHATSDPVEQLIKELEANHEEMPEFDYKLMERFQDEFQHSSKAKNYILGRGMNEFSMKTFNFGYDPGRGMVLTPMHDKDARLIGVIGRTIAGEKRFKNSKDLPSRKTLFNYHRARKTGSDTLIIVESNFDCIRAHQSGYPNTVATLSGAFSDYHLTQVSRSFSKVILAVDIDGPGEAFAGRISKKCRSAGMQVNRIQYTLSERLPHDAKDLSDCTDDEIAQAIKRSEIYVD